MEDVNKTEGTEQTKTYTQEEVNVLLQQEGDRRVTAALKKQQAKFDEAQKLAQMNEDEKIDYKLQQRVAELDKREAELAKKEMTAEVIKQLGDKGLPTDAAAFLVRGDADETNNAISAFEKMFNKAVKEAITKNMGGAAPKGSTGSQGMTKEEFNKLSLVQQANLYKTNPSLYKAMTT